MLPTQDKYPQFVPDQLLTSEHLNNLFNYLEEHDRLSRTNLIGIGIVCGLEVKIDSSSVTITKGCGVTSSGYLVTVEQKKYTHFKAFNPVKDIKYDRFVAANDTAKFPMDELKEAAVEEGTSPITAAYLKGKVVLIFVELLQEGAKNCDPNSCDDKGINITVTFRPLIIDAADAAKLQAPVAGNQVSIDAINALPLLKMRRFDVTATNLLETEDIFTAYRKVMSASFLAKTKASLTKTYNTLSPLVFDMYNTDPFTTLPTDFSFLHDNSITDNQLVNIQYYYDLFDDVMQAYEELRKKGMELLCLCCPDENLFPRHLLLGSVEPSNTVSIKYRQYFIASPIFCNHAHGIQELRWLFRRLVLMIQKFAVPAPSFTSRLKKGDDVNIRITPSKLGDVAVSKKSIPYYYKLTEGPNALLEYWDYLKTLHGQSKYNLSYHANKYNTQDDEILNPLLYDIEPNNFLRIEGHIGKPYTHAVKNILSIRNKYRLPFEVVALSGNVTNLRSQLLQLLRGSNLGQVTQLPTEGLECHFNDLEAQYETQRAELVCILCKELKYYYAFPGDDKLPKPNSLISQVSLLQYCDPTFQFTPNSLGHSFENFYTNFRTGYIDAETWLNSFKAVTAGATAANNNPNIGLILMYYIVKLHEGMTATLKDLNITEFIRRYDDLVKVAEFIKVIFQQPTQNNTVLAIAEDIIDHLDTLIYACKKAPMESLYKEYRLRWINVLMLQRFGYYQKCHPGIQHKGGVPMGGTFIVVYHEETVNLTNFTTGFIRDFSSFESVRSPLFFSSGNTAFAGSADAARASAETAASASKSSARETAASANAAGAFINTGETIGASASASIRANLLNQNYSINELNVAGLNITRYEDRLKQLLTLTKREDSIIDDVVEDIANGTVIADFYLPYICCSDCPPVQFVLNETPEQEQPTIDLDAKEYCSDDKTPYSIAVSPDGGKVSGEGVSVNADGSFVFMPAAVNLNNKANAKITLTYDINGTQATVEVIVYQKPTADFESFRGDIFTVYSFENKSKFAEKFVWDFGDGESSDEEIPTHDFKKPGVYNVSLAVSNGICTDANTKVITVQQQEPASIQIENRDYCSDDKTAFPVLVSPAGGKISGEGIKTNAAGNIAFSPTSVSMAGAQSKNVKISYTVNGTTAERELTVFQKPTSAFEINVNEENLLTVGFQNFAQFAEKFIWNFGDGQKSEEKDPTHTYSNGGVFVVTLEVVNGVCSATATETVQLATITSEPKSGCLPINDLLNTFSKLQSFDPANFASFNKNYTFLKDINSFFKELNKVVNDNPEKQVAFFSEISFGGGAATNNVKLNFQQVMIQWMGTLFNSFIIDSNEKTLLLALHLYRILENLAMYVACLQKEDINNAKVNMNDVFELIQKHLNQLKEIVPNFDTDKKSVIFQLVDDLQLELKRLKESGDNKTKPLYNRVLTGFIALIKSYNL